MSILTLRIRKGRKMQDIAVETDDVPEEHLHAIWTYGLRQIIMLGIYKPEPLDIDRKALQRKATKQLVAYNKRRARS